MAAFWEKEAQEHIAKKLSLWMNHLINAVGTTRVGTSLKCCAPPRNSPENGRGADSFGFADLYTRTAPSWRFSSRPLRRRCW
jgi:hypothetical protein